MLKRFQVFYQKPEDRYSWRVLSDTYPTFERACTVATALENRGYKTYIEDISHTINGLYSHGL